MMERWIASKLDQLGRFCVRACDAQGCAETRSRGLRRCRPHLARQPENAQPRGRERMSILVILFTADSIHASASKSLLLTRERFETSFHAQSEIARCAVSCISCVCVGSRWGESRTLPLRPISSLPPVTCLSCLCHPASWSPPSPSQPARRRVKSARPLSRASRTEPAASGSPVAAAGVRWCQQRLSWR
jgi:hypothetical protein